MLKNRQTNGGENPIPMTAIAVGSKYMCGHKIRSSKWSQIMGEK